MKKLLFLWIILLCGSSASAQHTIRLSVKKSESREPLAGATVTITSLKKSSVADSAGQVIFENIPEGSYTLTISFAGLKEQELKVTVPQPPGPAAEVLLEEAEEHEEEEVIITATRISRTITATPTRTEVISGEELEEKGNMKPGDIRMMLNESTGIQTQQTSATSFNAGIRIQGLEGRYTQLLRDGYPLYSGFAGSLSLLQIAPLDLKQVEVIKGAASTLYGGGAIAGLVNLVSKTPGQERELNFLMNATTAGGWDLSGFYSERFGKAGVTLFASRNSNRPFDPAGIGLTAIPEFERYTLNPRLFLYGKKTTIDAGINYTTENRTGGSMDYIKNGGNGFFEKNNTARITTQFGVLHQLSENAGIQLKNSFSRFDRLLAAPNFSFDALQQSSFTELTWNRKGNRSDWVIGANITTEFLEEKEPTNFPKRDYRYHTYGLFLQNVWTLQEWVVLESGLRGDHVNEYGFELLPRLSALFKVNSALTTRIGGGFGYKPPTIFTEEAERRQFRQVLPIDRINTRTERSVGFNWDINYKTTIGDVSLSFNQLFFYTRLNHPLVLQNGTGNALAFKNASGYLDTKGMETNLRVVYNHFKLFIGYTYTDARTNFDNTKEWLPLTARHRLNNVLMYEIEEKLKLGLEAYYFSRQRLTDGSYGQSYWITGFMAEKLWEKWSLFINFENFSNTRQSRFDVIYTGTIDNPVFRDIYAPVDGFVVNGGIKIRL
jgi:iron complex outermembrane receptor protein